MNTSIRPFVIVVVFFGAACLGAHGIRAQAAADPTHPGLWGPSAITVRAPVSLSDQQWRDTDVPKPKDKPDKPAEKPKPDKPAEKPKPDKAAEKPKPAKPSTDTVDHSTGTVHCHPHRYICGHHEESLGGSSVSVPDWCTETVCN